MNKLARVRIHIKTGVRVKFLPVKVKEIIREELTFANKAYADAIKYGRWVSQKLEKDLKYYYDDNATGQMLLPKGFVRRLIQILNENHLMYSIKDETYSTKKLLNIEFKGELRGYQQEATTDMLKYPNGVLEAGTGSGKCLGKGTPIIMFDGTIKKVEDIVIGDLIMGPDSVARRVKSLARGQEEMFKVIPTKGDMYIVNRSHILSLVLSGNNKCCGYDPNIPLNISVSDYLLMSKTFKHRAKGWRTGVEFKNKTINSIITPYILGVWLGDGNNINSGGIACPDEEIKNEIHSYAKSINMGIRECVHENKCDMFYITNGKNTENKFRDELDKYNLPNNKHIPHEFLCSTRENRLELLAGLLDTDGYYSKGCYDYISKDKQLANDICFLARSLGLAAYVAPKWVKLDGWETSREYYRFSICGDCSIIPCRVIRKQANKRFQKKDVLRVGIKVKSIGIGDYYGFELDGPDRLFLLGDFTVTHNTVMALYLIAQRKQETLIVVHSKELMYQWQARIRQFLGINCGLIGDSKYMLAPITVGIVNSVRKHINELKRSFGYVIVDETHRVPSTIFSDMLMFIHAKYITGLSATPFRNDGLDKVINAFIGPIMHRVDRERLHDEGAILKPKLLFVKSDFYTPSMQYSDVIKALSKDQNRNVLIAKIAMRDAAQNDGTVLITVDRVEMGNKIMDIIKGNGVDCRFLHGTISADDRSLIVKLVNANKCKIIIATNALIGEGFDVVSLSSLILGSPIKYSGKVIQVAGRVLRPQEGKVARIYDVRDDNIQMLYRQGLERIKVYREVWGKDIC